MVPRLPVRPREEPIGVLVAYYLLRFCIPMERPAEPHRQVRQDATGGRDVALFDVRHRSAAALNRRQQVLHVPADRRGDVPLQVLFRPVFGELLELVRHVAMDRFLLAVQRQ